MPVELVEAVYDGGDGLVGHDEDAAGAVDGADEVELGAGVRARAVEDGDPQRRPPGVQLGHPLVQQRGGRQDQARAQPAPATAPPRLLRVGERRQEGNHLHNQNIFKSLKIF